MQCLAELYGTRCLSKEDWRRALEDEKRICRLVSDQVYLTRLKDYENPFRRATYRNEDEMTAAIGRVENNSFVKQVASDTEKELLQIDRILNILGKL